jgi:hypothetical protein
MKNVPFILFIFLLYSCGIRSENKSPETRTKNQPETNRITEFEFSKEMHNFGTLQSGEIAVVTFEFKNTGNTALIIGHIESDCGCVKADFPKEPVSPGKTGIIKVEFDSSGLWGKQFKTIEIYANSKESKQLAIFAEVKNEQIEITY